MGRKQQSTPSAGHAKLFAIDSKGPSTKELFQDTLTGRDDWPILEKFYSKELLKKFLAKDAKGTSKSFWRHAKYEGLPKLIRALEQDLNCKDIRKPSYEDLRIVLATVYKESPKTYGFMLDAISVLSAHDELANWERIGNRRRTRCHLPQIAPLFNPLPGELFTGGSRISENDRATQSAEALTITQKYDELREADSKYCVRQSAQRKQYAGLRPDDRGDTLEALNFSPVELGHNFHTRSGLTLYLGYGTSNGDLAFYAGTTTRGLRRRHAEHCSGKQDRRYGFTLQGYLAWEIPIHWGSKTTASQYALAEDFLMYSLCKTLNGTGHWIDNRRYNTKVYDLTEGQIREVLQVMQASVYPRLESQFGLTIRPEPAPIQSKSRENLWLYVNGTRGSGPQDERIKNLCAANGWIYNRR